MKICRASYRPEQWMAERMTEARPSITSHLEVHRRDPQTLRSARHQLQILGDPIDVQIKENRGRRAIGVGRLAQQRADPRNGRWAGSGDAHGELSLRLEPGLAAAHRLDVATTPKRAISTA